MCVHVHKLASMHAWTHVCHIIERKKAKLHCQLITKILFSSSGVLFKVEKYSENRAWLVLLTLGLLTLSTVYWAQSHWRRLQRTASFPPRQGAALVSGITVWTVVGSQSLQEASALGELFHCLSRLPHWICVEGRGWSTAMHPTLPALRAPDQPTERKRRPFNYPTCM